MVERDYSGEEWYLYLDHSMRDLVVVSMSLLAREEAEKKGRFHDYSFVVFPMSKAYEGFLKKVFLETGLISRDQYAGKHFRVGKSLNPDLPVKYRNQEWVYQDMVDLCRGQGNEKLVDEMWEVWKRGRNQLFHYWPNHENFIGLEVARKRVVEIVAIMKKVVDYKIITSSDDER